MPIPFVLLSYKLQNYPIFLPMSNFFGFSFIVYCMEFHNKFNFGT